MSDDEDDTTDDFRGAGAKMGNIFAMDAKEKKTGNATFMWKPPEKKKFTADKTTSVAATGVNVGQDLFLENAVVRLFKDSALVGSCMCYLRAKPEKSVAPRVTLLFVDQKKTKLLETELSRHTYWVQQPYENQEQYVNLQDSNGEMWSLQFKKVEEATAFTEKLYSVLFSLSLFDTDAEPLKTFELLGGSGDVLAPQDTIMLRYRYMQLTPYDKCPTLLKPAATPFDSAEEGDPKKVKLEAASSGQMVGVYDRLLEMSKGQRRCVIVQPHETVLAGGGAQRPASVADGDVLLTFLDVVKVKKKKEAAPPPPAYDGGGSSALVLVDQPPPPPAPVMDVAPIHEEPAPAPVPVPAPVAVPVAAAPAPVAAAAPAAAPAVPLDTNALLTTLLVQQLGGGAPAAPAAAAPAAKEASASGRDVDELQKGMDRLMVQMGQLYQKIDHIDVTRKLEENNEKIEGVFRRVMGKAPSTGYDAYASGIDRNCDDVPTLLAEIEKREKKLEEMTQAYHNALASISENKEETSALKTDVTIERETAIQRLTEANERHRLVVVEMDAKHRSELEKAVDKAHKEGKEEGFKQGTVEGEREAFLKQVQPHNTTSITLPHTHTHTGRW